MLSYVIHAYHFCIIVLDTYVCVLLWWWWCYMMLLTRRNVDYAGRQHYAILCSYNAFEFEHTSGWRTLCEIHGDLCVIEFGWKSCYFRIRTVFCERWEWQGNSNCFTWELMRMIKWVRARKKAFQTESTEFWIFSLDPPRIVMANKEKQCLLNCVNLLMLRFLGNGKNYTLLVNCVTPMLNGFTGTGFLHWFLFSIACSYFSINF